MAYLAFDVGVCLARFFFKTEQSQSSIMAMCTAGPPNAVSPSRRNNWASSWTRWAQETVDSTGSNCGTRAIFRPSPSQQKGIQGNLPGTYDEQEQ